jgi:hypothetical protein
VQVRDRVLDQVRGRAYDLAFKKDTEGEEDGCRLVQKALYAAWLAGGKALDDLLRELLFDSRGCEAVPKMIQDENANFVVPRMLVVLLEDARGPGAIVKQLEGRAAHWASHGYGYRVLDELLKHGANLPECAAVVQQDQGSVLRNHRLAQHVMQHVPEHPAEAAPVA